MVFHCFLCLSLFSKIFVALNGIESSSYFFFFSVLSQDSFFIFLINWNNCNCSLNITLCLITHRTFKVFNICDWKACLCYSSDTMRDKSLKSLYFLIFHISFVSGWKCREKLLRGYKRNSKTLFDCSPSALDLIEVYM